MNKVLSWFVKITGYPVQFFYFHKKIYYEDKKHTNKKIKGAALIVSNHTSIYDYPLMMYTFPSRNLHVLAAEVIYEKNFFLTHLVKGLGAIKVDRNAHDFAFMSEMIDVLNNKGVCLIYPESRLPKEEEKGSLLEFKPSYIYLAMECGVPIIPVYTNGVYGKLKRKKKDRARVVIGKKIYISDLINENLSEKENIEFINDYIKNKIISLKTLLEETSHGKEKA